MKNSWLRHCVSVDARANEAGARTGHQAHDAVPGAEDKRTGNEPHCCGRRRRHDAGRISRPRAVAVVVAVAVAERSDADGGAELGEGKCSSVHHGSGDFPGTGGVGSEEVGVGGAGAPSLADGAAPEDGTRRQAEEDLVEQVVR